MTNPSNYFSIEELAKRWNLKAIDVSERIVKDKIAIKADSLEDIYWKELGFRRLRPISEVEKRPPEKKFVSKKDIEQYEKQHPELTKSLPDLINHQYLFRREGPAWKIVFEGRFLTGLKGKGFTYIHYLVLKTPDPVYIPDLIGLCGEVGLPNISSQKLIDHKSSRDYLTRIDELDNEITEAERNNDIGQKEKAQQELELLRELLNDDKRGKQFVNETTSARDRIAISIRRALAQIEIHDKPAAEHFRSALSPIKTFHPSYSPHTPIPWDF